MKLSFKKGHRLIHNDFIHSVSVLMSGTAISQFAIVLVTPILTRLYGPEAFGLYALFTAFLYTISTISSLHYEAAIPMPKSKKDAMNLMSIALLVLGVTVTLLTIGMMIIKQPMISALFGLEQLPLFWFLLPVSILGLGMYQIFQLWSLRVEAYKSIAKSRVYMNMTQVIAQLSLGLIAGTGGLLSGGDAIGRVSGSVGLAYLNRKELIRHKGQISWWYMKKMMARYRKFPLISSWSSVFHQLSTHMPTLFIAGLIGVKAAGWYMIAVRILSLPDALIGFNVKQVYIAKGAKLLQRSFTDFVTLFFHTVKQLLLVATILFSVAFFAAPPLFPFLLGEAWAEAGIYVQCMCLLYFCLLITGPITANFYLLELFHVQIIAEITRFSILALGMLYAAHYLTKPWQIILAISMAGAIGSIIIGILSWHCLFMYGKRESHQQQEQIE